MEFSQDLRKQYKETFKKECGEYTDNEVDSALQNLSGFFDLIFKHAQKEIRLEKRLGKEPDRFPVDGQYSCLVCGCGINPANGWWDYYGPKCLLCQKAIKDDVIPAYICKHRDSYFSIWSLMDGLKIKTPTIKKMIREGKLKARIVPDEYAKPHVYIFLKRENPSLIQKYNPIRKSCDRNRDKQHKKWVQEKNKQDKSLNVAAKKCLLFESALRK